MTLLEDRTPETHTAAKKPISVQERKRRKERRLTWILPIVAIVVTIAVAITTVIFVRAANQPPRTPERDEVSLDQTTQLGEAGLAYAAQYAIYSVNLSNQPLTSEEVRMGPDDTVVVQGSGGTSVQATFYIGQAGGDDGEGYFIREMYDVTVQTQGGVVTSIEGTEALVNFGNFSQLTDSLRRGVDAFGWGFDAATEATLEQQVSDAVRAGEPTSAEIASGTTMGMPIGARVDCAASGYCGLTYVVQTAA